MDGQAAAAGLRGFFALPALQKIAAGSGRFSGGLGLGSFRGGIFGGDDRGRGGSNGCCGFLCRDARCAFRMLDRRSGPGRMGFRIVEVVEEGVHEGPVLFALFDGFLLGLAHLLL